MSLNSQILIVDDDETLCYLLKEELLNLNFKVDLAYNGKSAIQSIKNKNYDLLLLDLEMGEISGEEILDFVKEDYPDLQAIVLTAKSEMRTAIECIKKGAYDFINKPYEFPQLLVIINRALEHKELIVKNRLLSEKIKQITPHQIIGDSDCIKEIISLAERAAKSDSNILLEGETGTGKELFAEFIHHKSERNEKPLVAINCASLPDQLLESELFGFEKGAFTDAKSSKQGLVEIANRGTLFFDEIGELSLVLQPKLLRFLEKGEFRRIGGISNLNSDVRVIGATNKNLLEESENKNFRKDLLFRLNVITLTIPPLRKRGNDVLILANYFLEKKSPLKTKKNLSPDAEKKLLQYDYPGNVRELEHIIERAIIFSEDNTIQAKDLYLPKSNGQEFAFDEGEVNGVILPMDKIEEKHIRKVLIHHNWNREKSAHDLGISLKTLYTKIKKYDLK